MKKQTSRRKFYKSFVNYMLKLQNDNETIESKLKQLSLLNEVLKRTRLKRIDIKKLKDGHFGCYKASVI